MLPDGLHGGRENPAALTSQGDDAVHGSSSSSPQEEARGAAGAGGNGHTDVAQNGAGDAAKNESVGAKTSSSDATICGSGDTRKGSQISSSRPRLTSPSLVEGCCSSAELLFPGELPC